MGPGQWKQAPNQVEPMCSSIPCSWRAHCWGDSNRSIQPWGRNKPAPVAVQVVASVAIRGSVQSCVGSDM